MGMLFYIALCGDGGYFGFGKPNPDGVSFMRSFMG